MIKILFILTISRPVLLKKIENETFRSLRDNLIDENLTKSLKTNIFNDEVVNMSGKSSFFFNRNITEPQTVSNKTFVRHAHNKTRKYVINYQKVYGLRYSPSDFGIRHTEPEMLPAMSSPLPTKILAPIDNVMRPTPVSRVHATMDLIKTRLQNLITLGANSSSKENKIIQEALTPTKRFLSLFSVIQFNNVPCVGGPVPLRQLQGTCYHKMECAELGGMSVGSCIAGFAVCCVCKR